MKIDGKFNFQITTGVHYGTQIKLAQYGGNGKLFECTNSNYKMNCGRLSFVVHAPSAYYATCYGGQFKK